MKSMEKPESLWTHYIRRFRKHTLGKVGLGILVVLYTLALFADILSPYSMAWRDKTKPYHSPAALQVLYQGPRGTSFRPFVYEERINNVMLRTYGPIPEHSIRAISIEGRIDKEELRAVAVDTGAASRRNVIEREVLRHYRFARDSQEVRDILAAVDTLEADPDPDARMRVDLGFEEGPNGTEIPRTLILAKGNKNFLGFFPQGLKYSMWGVFTLDRHFFGSETGGYFPLGTDATGRDIMSRLLHGARVSLTVGIIGAAITIFLGMFIGGLSGYFGGWIDNTLMRFTEILISIPSLYLLIALRASLPSGLDSTQVYFLIIFILSFIGWSSVARVIRGQVLSIKNEDYVLSARTMGLSHLKIIRRHVLPQTFSYAIIQTTILIPSYILGESALSLLGLGISEPQSSWGLMLAVGRQFRVVDDFPFVLIPGVLIFLAILAWNFFGDGVRDALDPKSKH